MNAERSIPGSVSWKVLSGVRGWLQYWQFYDITRQGRRSDQAYNELSLPKIPYFYLQKAFDTSAINWRAQTVSPLSVHPQLLVSRRLANSSKQNYRPLSRLAM